MTQTQNLEILSLKIDRTFQKSAWNEELTWHGNRTIINYVSSNVEMSVVEMMVKPVRELYVIIRLHVYYYDYYYYYCYMCCSFNLSYDRSLACPGESRRRRSRRRVPTAWFYVYIYIYIEREREIIVCMYVLLMRIYIYIYIWLSLPLHHHVFSVRCFRLSSFLPSYPSFFPSPRFQYQIEQARIEGGKAPKGIINPRGNLFVLFCFGNEKPSGIEASKEPKGIRNPRESCTLICICLFQPSGPLQGASTCASSAANRRNIQTNMISKYDKYMHTK